MDSKKPSIDVLIVANDTIKQAINDASGLASVQSQRVDVPFDEVAKWDFIGDRFVDAASLPAPEETAAPTPSVITTTTPEAAAVAARFVQLANSGKRSGKSDAIAAARKAPTLIEFVYKLPGDVRTYKIKAASRADARARIKIERGVR